MENNILNFSDFLNEDLNFTNVNGICKLESRWFYYVPDDDIIYGSDDIPVGDDKLFSFNPISCEIILGGKKKKYDVNNPICLIKYNIDENEVTVYTDDAMNFLKSLGFDGDDIQSQQSSNKLNDLFETFEDDKYILLYGNQMIASTFDVIEEN